MNLNHKKFAIGIDLVAIIEIEKIYKKHGDRFANKILTQREFALFMSNNKKVSFLAGRFAVKEAIFKALGYGFKNFGPTFKSLEVLPNEVGQPHLEVLKPLKQHVDTSFVWSVSISHHKAYSNAIAMWIKF